MTAPGPTLREIHRLRRHARDLQTEIERGPRALKAQENRLAQQEANQHAAQEGLKHQKVATHEKEGSLRAVHQQITKYQKQQNEAAGSKEYEALRSEIVAAQKSAAELEDQILESMAATEEQTARLPSLEQAVARAKDELAKFRADYQPRQDRLASELQQVQTELKQVETGLPDDMRQQYTRLTTAMGADAITAVEGRTCVACYTEITAQNYNELMQGHFVACKSCGRMLYLAE